MAVYQDSWPHHQILCSSFSKISTNLRYAPVSLSLSRVFCQQGGTKVAKRKTQGLWGWLWKQLNKSICPSLSPPCLLYNREENKMRMQGATIQQNLRFALCYFCCYQNELPDCQTGRRDFDLGFRSGAEHIKETQKRENSGGRNGEHRNCTVIYASTRVRPQQIGRRVPRARSRACARAMESGRTVLAI